MPRPFGVDLWEDALLLREGRSEALSIVGLAFCGSAMMV